VTRSGSRAGPSVFPQVAFGRCRDHILPVPFDAATVRTSGMRLRRLT
jgi:hypothetical protein